MAQNNLWLAGLLTHPQFGTVRLAEKSPTPPPLTVQTSSGGKKRHFLMVKNLPLKTLVSKSVCRLPCFSPQGRTSEGLYSPEGNYDISVEIMFIRDKKRIRMVITSEGFSKDMHRRTMRPTAKSCHQRLYGCHGSFDWFSDDPHF